MDDPLAAIEAAPEPLRAERHEARDDAAQHDAVEAGLDRGELHGHEAGGDDDEDHHATPGEGVHGSGATPDGRPRRHDPLRSSKAATTTTRSTTRRNEPDIEVEAASEPWVGSSGLARSGATSASAPAT